MYFYVDFHDKQKCYINVDNNHTANVEVYVSIKDITLMLHDICDDFDMVRPQDMEILKEAIDHFNYLTKVED